MPRPNSSAPPKGYEELQVWIRKVLEGSESAGIPLLLKLPILRPVKLRINCTDFVLSTVTQRLAVGWQQRGTESSTACAGCRSGKGPFAECCTAPSRLEDRYHLYGKCANCFYSGAKQCSLTTSTSGRISQTIQTHDTAALQKTLQSLRSRTDDETDPVSYPPTKKQMMSPVAQRKPRPQRASKLYSSAPVSYSVPGMNLPRPGNDALSNSYHILGLFSLPDPGECNLDEAHKLMAEACRPHLQDFQKRDMTLIQKTIGDTMRAFDRFSEHEVSAWKNITGKDYDKALLVKPSGSLKSPVAHHLHQPSFTTLNRENGETLDETNGCTRLLLETGFTANNSFVFDHIHRREEKSEAITTYPAPILQCHEQLTWKYMESMEAKVEILYGIHVQQRLLQDPRLEYIILPLWGRYEGILLLIILEKSFSNAQAGHYIRRLTLFSPHPQRFFYEKENSPLTIKQDLMMEAVEKMAGGCIELERGYWQARKWLRSRTNLLLLKAIKEAKPTEDDLAITSSIQDVPPVPLEFKAAQGVNNLEQRPASNEALRKMLPEALAAASAAVQEGSEWSNESDLPDAVARWWKAQRFILFRGNDNPQVDKAPALLKTTYSGTSKQELFDGVSVPRCLYQTMQWQDEVLQKIGEKSKYEALYHSDFCERRVELECPRCGTALSEDTAPRWSVRLPGKYWPRGRKCYSASCQSNKKGLSVSARPCDESIEYTTRIETYQELPQKCNFDPYLLSDDQKREQSLPMNLKVCCIRCRGSQKDVPAKFTRGRGNPLFVSITSKCSTCQGRLRAMTDFVPVDERFKFIHLSRLRNIIKLFGHHHELIINNILQYCPDSQRRLFRRDERLGVASK